MYAVSVCICAYSTLCVCSNSSYEACMCESEVFECADRPASRGQVELCPLLLSTPLPVLALVSTLDCNGASLVQLHFSSVCNRDWLGETVRKRVGIEMRL